MLTRSALTFAGAIMIGLVAAVPAAAGDLWVDLDCDQNPSPTCDLGVGDNDDDHEDDRPPVDHDRPDGDGNGDQPDGPEVPHGCEYVSVDETPWADEAPPPKDEEGGWFQLRCPMGDITLWGKPVWVPDGEEPDGESGPSVEDVAQVAYARVKLSAPQIRVSPPSEQLVHLPTWLWLDRGDWTEVSATASVPGVSVTAVATPESVTWSMGDGGTVTCAGPGTPFMPGQDPAAGSPDCGHIYTEASGQREVSATVEWRVAWSGAGRSGTFPSLTTQSSTQVRIVEAPTLTTN